MEDSSGNPVAGMNDCRGNVRHDHWVQIASGLAGGKTYRIHTFSTDPSSPTRKRSTTALNNFAFYATASGGNPKVYGIGARSLPRLPQNQTSDFYMADEAVHGQDHDDRAVGPGRHGRPAATLQVLQPTRRATARDLQLHRHAGEQQRGCLRPSPDLNVTSVVTNTGGSSRFNGLLAHHHHPAAGELLRAAAHGHHRDEGGWWQMRYIMGSGTGSRDGPDHVEGLHRGNPVHLVVP